MWSSVVLPYRDVLVRVFEDGATVVVDVEVVWGGEDGDDRGELFGGGLAEHSVADSCVRMEYDGAR